MRKIHIQIFIGLLLIAQFQVQVNAQDCDKDISTNPAQPYNNHPFFHMVDGETFPRYNPWINSDFNIGELVNGNVPPLYINNQVGWQIPNFEFGETFEMKNPFASGTTGNTYSNTLRKICNPAAKYHNLLRLTKLKSSKSPLL